MLRWIIFGSLRRKRRIVIVQKSWYKILNLIHENKFPQDEENGNPGEDGKKNKKDKKKKKDKEKVCTSHKFDFLLSLHSLRGCNHCED